jgi:DnaJ-class molecular chaperone
MNDKAKMEHLLLDFTHLAHSQGVEDQSCEAPAPCADCDRIDRELNEMTAELLGVYNEAFDRAEAAEAALVDANKEYDDECKTLQARVADLEAALEHIADVRCSAMDDPREQRRDPCEVCDPCVAFRALNAFHAPEPEEPCDGCGGSGTFERHEDSYGGGVQVVEAPCPKCQPEEE